MRLNKVVKELDCTVYAKCEFFNPGGSIKDRVALNMVEMAEKKGLIRPGDTLVEPTSGNTGIGLALVGALKGYKVIIVMPDKMSQERQSVIEALGAQVIRTPSEEPSNSPKSHMGVATEMAKEEGFFQLDQYVNPSNPLAHELSTAEEIWKDMEGDLDMVVVPVGTGGTVTGLAKTLKARKKDLQVIGVDPVGSVIAEKGEGEADHFEVEGMGYDFLPEIVDYSLVDEWFKSNDKDSFYWAKRLIQEEGLLCGGSSGAALSGVMAKAKSLGKGKKCVVILPDNSRNYLSKFLNPLWLKSKGLKREGR